MSQYFILSNPEQFGALYFHSGSLLLKPKRYQQINWDKVQQKRIEQTFHSINESLSKAVSLPEERPGQESHIEQMKGYVQSILGVEKKPQEIKNCYVDDGEDDDDDHMDILALIKIEHPSTSMQNDPENEQQIQLDNQPQKRLKKLPDYSTINIQENDNLVETKSSNMSSKNDQQREFEQKNTEKPIQFQQASLNTNSNQNVVLPFVGVKKSAMNPVLMKLQTRGATAGIGKSPFEFEVKLEEKVEESEKTDYEGNDIKEGLIAQKRILESEDDEDDSDDREMLKQIADNSRKACLEKERINKEKRREIEEMQNNTLQDKFTQSQGNQSTVSSVEEEKNKEKVRTNEVDMSMFDAILAINEGFMNDSDDEEQENNYNKAKQISNQNIVQRAAAERYRVSNTIDEEDERESAIDEEKDARINQFQEKNFNNQTSQLLQSRETQGNLKLPPSSSNNSSNSQQQKSLLSAWADKKKKETKENQQVYIPSVQTVENVNAQSDTKSVILSKESSVGQKSKIQQLILDRKQGNTSKLSGNNNSNSEILPNNQQSNSYITKEEIEVKQDDHYMDEEDDSLFRNFEGEYYDLLQGELTKKQNNGIQKQTKKSKKQADDNKNGTQTSKDKPNTIAEGGGIPKEEPALLHPRRKKMKESVEECKVWHYFISKLYHLSSEQFEKELIAGTLPQELSDYNIKQINRGNFNNRKIPRLVVVIIQFEILHQIVKTILLDFSGSLIGSFSKTLFMDDKGDSNPSVAIKKEEDTEDDDEEEEIESQINGDKDNSILHRAQPKRRFKPIDFSTVYTINHEKGTQIALKPDTLLVLKNVTVIQQNEEPPFINISERNIMQVVYPF